MRTPVNPDPANVDLNFCALTGVPRTARQAQIKLFRQQSPEIGDQIDRYFLERMDYLDANLREAQKNHQELKAIVNKILAPPWFPAVFIGPMLGVPGKARVQQGNTERVVGLDPNLTMDSLRTGDQVFLNHELNLITAIGSELPPCGELAAFDSYTPSNFVVVNRRDDKLVLRPAHPLQGRKLKAGDLLRIDPHVSMAFEQLESPSTNEFMLEDIPPMSRDQLGGQETQYEAYFDALAPMVLAPEKARCYGLSGRPTVLLEGPPGCGKTFMTRIVVSEIAQLAGRKCRMALVKPGAWASPYVGMTEQNIRNTFRVLRDLAREGTICVLFCDEIESITRTRGHFTNIHGDGALAAFLAEVEGFDNPEGLIVIGATNRKELIDAAALSRFSTEIHVGRPDQRAAKAIFDIHLSREAPFSPNGPLAAQTREQVIESAVSRLYAPNADNALCRLRFRDAKERTICARELISGRLIAQLCQNARRRAFSRDVRANGAEPGISVADMDAAITQGLEQLRTTLTPRNAHEHLSDLPQDQDIVSIEPCNRKITNRRRYLTIDPL